jgi:hypothetical protein
MVKIIAYMLATVFWVLAAPAILYVIVVALPMVPVFGVLAWWRARSDGADFWGPWYVKYYFRDVGDEHWIPIAKADDIFGQGRFSVENQREAVLQFRVVDPRIPEGGKRPTLPAERRKWWAPVF